MQNLLVAVRVEEHERAGCGASLACKTLAMIEEIAVNRSNRYASALIELALRFRVEGSILGSFDDPTPDSPFVEANGIFEWEKASDWCREYLSAAFQSASMWADHHAPMTFDPKAVVVIRPRPLQGMARSVLEAASQAVWVMTGDSNRDLAEKHLQLMYSDYLEQRKAYRLQGKRIDAAQAQLDKFKQRVEQSHVDSAKVLKKISYLAMIRGATEALSAMGKKIAPDEVEYVWRLASGATHGKRWTAFELNDVERLEEYEPGQLRVSRTTRLDVAYRAFSLAYEMAHFGVVMFAARSGLDYFSAQQAAILQVAENIPVAPNRERERQDIIKRLAGQ